MSDIKFYLKAEADYRGAPCVREFYELSTGRRHPKSDGTMLAEVLSGYVDEAVKKQYRDQYKKFSDYVNLHERSLFERARKGEVIYCPEVVVEVPAVVESAAEVEAPIESAEAPVEDPQ